MNNPITATYSPEDNKLRLYAAYRLDDDLYQQVSEAGFKWAPKQELFVAPSWTPAREDLCFELAGDIEAEGTTLVERAEAKAARLDNLAAKRASESNSFYAAASRISQRFEGGQPILVGHHSERAARRDQERMHSAMDKSVKALNAVSYWNYRAEGVERHANRKANAGVRQRRIKTLLAELRDRQRNINHAFICLELWHKIADQSGKEGFDDLVKNYSDARIATGSTAPWYDDESLWSQLEKGSISSADVVDICLKFHERQANSIFTTRWINHLLNRLAFERSELGEVDRFDGQLTAAILQTFARTHGAHKPKATKDGNNWVLSSSAPLPLHIADSKELTLSTSDWLDLMQSSGYEVPAAKAKPAPILNFKAQYIKAQSWSTVQTFRQIELTKAEYSNIYSDYRGVKLSECGQFRVKICKNPEQRGYDAEWCAVFITDSKVHDAPESISIIYQSEKSA